MTGGGLLRNGPWERHLEVAVVADGEYPAGVQTIVWRAASRTGRPLAAGVYYYRLKAVGTSSGRQFVKSMRMVITR